MNSYRTGRGAHNYRYSVARAFEASRHEVKQLARRMNTARQRQLAEYDGIKLPLETNGWGEEE